MNMSEAEAEQEPYLRVVLIMDRKHNCPGASQCCMARQELLLGFRNIAVQKGGVGGTLSRKEVRI